MPIPIGGNKPLEWTDPDAGITYHFRYLLGSYQTRYLALQGKIQKSIKQFLPAIKKSGAKSREATVKAIAAAMANAEADPAEEMLILNEMIDIFVCGWSGKGIEPFPRDGKPSDACSISEKQKLVAAINGMLQKLTFITVEMSRN